MEPKVSFHLVDDHIKFEVKDYLQITSENEISKTWETNDFAISFSMHKTSERNWDSITHRSYGQKKLRFTHKADKSIVGLHLVVQVLAQQLASLLETQLLDYKVDYSSGFSYSYKISLRSTFKENLKGRRAMRSHQFALSKERKKAIRNSKTKYTCYNPRPLEGGKFSGN